MKFFALLLKFLDAQMPTPQPYGWFHLLWFFLSVAAAVVLCIYHKRHKSNPRLVVLFTTLAVILLEIYKQINYSFSYENGISFDYQWYIFPFQFCSTPMYAGLLMGLCKKGRLHEAAAAYTATFSLFAGAAVMFYPTTVFIGTIGINIQTMVCHGSMIFLGIYLLATEYVPLRHKSILRALPLFAVFLSIAAVLNEIAHKSGLLERESFNMFFISPHQDPHLPVYSIVQQHVPYPFCLILYIIGFTAAAYIILLLAMLCKKLCSKKETTKKKEVATV